MCGTKSISIVQDWIESLRRNNKNPSPSHTTKNDGGYTAWVLEDNDDVKSVYVNEVSTGYPIVPATYGADSTRRVFSEL